MQDWRLGQSLHLSGALALRRAGRSVLRLGHHAVHHPGSALRRARLLNLVNSVFCVGLITVHLSRQHLRRARSHEF
jgi:hypothetical protein